MGLSDIFKGSTEGIIDGVGSVVDRFITTSDEKNEFKLEMERVVNDRMAQASTQAIAEYDSKKEVIVAELNQDDLFTKRARPTIVYTGLGVIVYNYCFVPTLQTIMGIELTQFTLPYEFWVAWGGVCGIYSWGRSKEKMKS